MKNKLRRLFMLCPISVILLSLFMSCTPVPEETMPSPIEITDQLGRIVRLDKIPQRIVSLAPSNTEILFDLGLADRLVAVTDYCDYPPEAKDKPSIGGFSTPNIEEVVAHSPDLILAASRHEDKVIPQLEQKGFAILALSPETLDKVLSAIALVGEATGNKQDASELVTQIRKRIKAVTDTTLCLPPEHRLRVFYAVWHDPLTTAGSGTLQDELIQKAGGTNIAYDLTDYSTISLERVIQANPEVMIAGGGHGSGKEKPFQFIETDPRLRDSAARQNNKVYMIDGNLVSRAGPRIVDGLETFAKFIHPELFK